MEYYWSDTSKINLLERYTTIWKGTLTNENIDLIWIKPGYIEILKDIFVDVCQRNFHIILDEMNIYISLCQDSPYYYYEFEKDILKLLKGIEKRFNVKIKEGEFTCWECKPLSNSYRYFIYKNDNKFKLKKNILNWEIFDKKIKK